METVYHVWRLGLKLNMRSLTHQPPDVPIVELNLLKIKKSKQNIILIETLFNTLKLTQLHIKRFRDKMYSSNQRQNK